MNRKKALTVVIVVVVAVSVGLIVYFTNQGEQISVEYIQSYKDVTIFEQKATKYEFHIKIDRQTTWTTPFGTTSEQMAKSLQPLMSKYNLVPFVGEEIPRPALEALFINVGESTFSLYSYDTLSSEQINSLTVDLRDAIAKAPNY